MRTIGMIGGMSWESTVSYYKTVNSVVKNRLGGLHSAKCLMYSVDFHEIAECQKNGQWEESAVILAKAAASLERAGADFLIICTNTMHKVAAQVEAAVSVPLLHIADETAHELLGRNIRRVGLLGTQYTMEQDFYTKRLEAKGITPLIPDAEERATINRAIFEELCLGTVSQASKRRFLSIIDRLAQNGAEGIILGCTEIGLLVQQQDTHVPLFDTAEIHARNAALYALGKL